MVLIISAVGLGVLGLVALPPSVTEQAVVALVTSISPGLDGLWQLLVEVLVVAAVVVLVVALVRRRFRLVRDVTLALLVAAGLSLFLGHLVQGSWTTLWTAPASEGDWSDPLTLLIAPGTLLVTASPHLAKTARRAGKWLVVLAGVALVALGAAPSAAIAAVLVATASAALVHLVFGSPKGRPSLGDVGLALARLGVQPSSLGVAERQSTGFFLVDAVGANGEHLIVKVYGRDAYDTQLLTTAWRTVWYREAGAPLAFGRRQQVEREAFLTLLAGQAGVLTERVVAAGVTEEDDALLVLSRVGTRLSGLPRDWTVDLVRRVWDTVQLLHGAGISHGQLDDAHFVIDSDRIGVLDFRGGDAGRVVERMRTDRAQVLVMTAQAIEPQEALQCALEALGSAELAQTLPCVQVSTLTWRQRQMLRSSGMDLDDLRKRAALIAQVAPPELRRVHRVTRASLLRTGLLVVAFLALSSQLAGLDVANLWEQLATASWLLLAAGAVLAQLTRPAQAVSMLGAAPVPLPLGPVYGLQLAQSYVSLAVPTSAARIALNVRFLQRHGLSSGSALAIGAVDGFAGFIVQAMLLGGLLLLTPLALDLDLAARVPSGLGWLALVVILLAVTATAVLLLVSRWRRPVLGWLSRTAREAVATVRDIKSPRRIGLLFAGSLGAELLFALALGAFAAALGYPIGITELLVINMSVSLMAGLLPVPGGIGVIEGGLTYGLVRAGLPEDVAFAAVIMYRLATFYLPPVWGYFALRWLERARHL